MTDKIVTEKEQNASVAPSISNVEASDNQDSSIDPGKKFTTAFITESLLENAETADASENQTHDNDNTIKPSTTNIPSRPPEISDNVSIANSEVVLRRPNQLGRYLSNREPHLSMASTIPHSHSTSDLRNNQHPFGRSISKESRSMILPIQPNNRPRSHYVNSQSYGDGLNFIAHQFNNSNPNLTFPSTPQERFVPYIPGDGGGFQNGGYNNGGFIVSNGDFDHYKRNSFTPVSPNSDHHSPTSTEAKKQMFRDILSTSGSTIYALFILTLGISLYVIDFLELNEERISYLAAGFSLALVCTALLYIIFLIVDIAIYSSKKRTFEKLMEDITAEQIELKETNDGIAYDLTLHKALALRKQLDHRYCFNMDRHSSNFYLKVGAVGFCFGHLIHSFLILSYRGILLNSTDSDIDISDCSNPIFFTLEIIYPFYSVVLLFFIFKYSNVIINRHRDFHRFGFMHCLSASLCFWVWTIFRETAEYIQYQQSKYGNETIPESLEHHNSSDKAMLRIISPMRFTKMCETDELNIVYQNYSPYLYPFSVEYSILVVGILYIVWINIGLCAGSEAQTEDQHGEDTRECKNHRPIEFRTNLIQADCHAATKGLFGGFIIFVLAIVSIILFFITYYNAVEQAQTGYIVNTVTSIVIICCMIVASIFAYSQMVKLDINGAAHNSLDNFLCLMCLPAFFVNGIFSIIPGIIYGQSLSVIHIVFEFVQIIIQTTFIIDGMARSSNTKELRKKKPGREFVTFLAICNVAMWIMQTFEVKSHGLNQYRQDFYSTELWSIVGHICLPLMMFYRFHSSVCIVDIWKYAYVPSGH